MRLVYRFNNHEKNKELLNLCRVSKDLYNQSLHKFIESFESEEHKFLSYYDLNRIMQTEENLEGKINYKLLKAQVAQQTLKVLDKSLKAYFKSIKDWKLHKDKYKGMPRLPKYLPKNGYFNMIYTNQSCTIKDGKLYFSRDLYIHVPQWKKYGTKLSSFQQVRVLPRNGYTIIEIVYEDKGAYNEILDYERFSSIDLGVDNFVTLVTDFSEPLLYNGKQIKSKNQWFNKELSRLKSEAIKCNKRHNTATINKLFMKRGNELDDMLHKVSKHIVRKLTKNGVGNVVCGRNKGWKDSICLGNKTNQTFVQIPYERLIDMLRYKCAMVGIKFIENEESYTSKCDALALEDICKHEVYFGKRVKRGLFQSSVGKAINADVNGALNIMRKVVGDSRLITEIIDSGRLFRPKKLKDLYHLIS